MRRRYLAVIVVIVLVGVTVFITRCQRGSDRGEVDRDEAGTDRRTSKESGGKDPRTQSRASIAGTITSEDLRKPLARALVCARTDQRGLPLSLSLEPFCTQTNAQGEYAIKNLYAATYIVSAMADRHPAVQAPALDLHPGETRTGVDLQLTSGGVEVNGTVFDIGGGPIAHARVQVYPLTTFVSSPTVETDESGAFRLWAWPGNISIYAEADGYTGATEYGLAPGSFSLSLTIAGSLSGTVVDAGTGRPVAGSRVTLSTEAETMGGYGSFELTDEQGQFRFERLNAGRYTVAATAEHGYGRTDGSILVELGRNSEGAIVKLHPAARVEGRILVEGTPETPCPKAWFTLSLGKRPGDDLWARADMDGFVRHDGVLPGSYTVNIDCPGHARTETSFKLEVGDRDVTGMIWKFAKVNGGTARGHVRDSSGAPIAGAYVEANGADFGWTTTRSDGVYEIKALAPGEVSLHVTSPRGVGKREGWKVVIPTTGNVEQDLVLDSSGTIQGAVTDTDGKAVSGMKVSASFGRHYPEVTTGRDGTFRYDNVPPGEVSVVVEEPGAPVQRSVVVVRAGAASRVSFVVAARPGKITGTVVDDKGNPVGDAVVTARRDLEGPSVMAGRASTAVDGSFTLSPLVSGKYRLRATREGAGETIVEQVETGSNARLQIKATGSIAGVVKGSREVVDVVVGIENTRTGLSRTERFYRTGGRYHFDDLPGGSYQITARSGDGEGQTVVELASGAKLNGVDLVFASGRVEGRVVEVISKQPVPGVRVGARLKAGKREHETVTGQDGRFVFDDLASGTVVFAVYVSDSYEYLDLTRDVKGSTTIGDIAIVRKRNLPRDQTGRLGLTFATDSLRVIEVEASGPAAKAQLAVGDVVTAIDGLDLAGVERRAAISLLTVPVGTTIRLGLARGTTIVLTAAPR